MSSLLTRIFCHVAQVPLNYPGPQNHASTVGKFMSLVEFDKSWDQHLNLENVASPIIIT